MKTTTQDKMRCQSIQEFSIENTLFFAEIKSSCKSLLSVHIYLLVFVSRCCGAVWWCHKDFIHNAINHEQKNRVSWQWVCWMWHFCILSYFKLDQCHKRMMEYSNQKPNQTKLDAHNTHRERERTKCKWKEEIPQKFSLNDERKEKMRWW